MHWQRPCHRYWGWWIRLSTKSSQSQSIANPWSIWVLSSGIANGYPITVSSRDRALLRVVAWLLSDRKRIWLGLAVQVFKIGS